MNAFDRADQVVRELRLPMYHREAIRALAKQIVLDAAECCEDRANAKERDNAGMSLAAISEARKCADQIRHNLLCRGTESICIRCDGAGCEACNLGILPTGGYSPKPAVATYVAPPS